MNQTGRINYVGIASRGMEAIRRFLPGHSGGHSWTLMLELRHNGRHIDDGI